MHKVILGSLVAISLVACQDAPDADKAIVAGEQTETNVKGETLAIDTNTSNVTWIGTKPTGQHTGTFSLNTGSLTVNGDELKGGNFTINIGSLNSTDMEGEYKTKLDGHLKSADFFDVEKHPTAAFTITDVEPFDSTNVNSLLPGATHLISGNLTIKDSTKNITFPAQIKWDNKALMATANFNIDRTLWGMSYGNDESLKDKFIRPDVNIQLNIATKKM